MSGENMTLMVDTDGSMVPVNSIMVLAYESKGMRKATDDEKRIYQHWLDVEIWAAVPHNYRRG